MFRKMITSLIIILTIVFALVLGGLYYYMNKINRIDVKGVSEATITEDVARKNELKVATNSLGISDDLKKEVKENKKDGVKNILLLGIDSSDGVGRSDSIMILSINPNTKMIKVSSLMRDSKVYISGHDNDKLNHAFAFGGPDLSIFTVNSNFDLNIEDFVSVDFSSITAIVDHIGGIDINLTSEEASILGLNEGINSLNGSEVLRYSRIRSTEGGDFIRTSRQRTVINALLSKAMNQSTTELATTINELLPFTKTSLKNSSILSLALSVSTNKYSIAQDYFPNTSEANGMIEDDGVFYIEFDKKLVKDRLHNFIFN